MQLDAPNRPSLLRSRLSAAACILLASGASAVAHADAGETWQFDGSALLYGEKSRTRVVEPIGRITRLFPNGQSLSAQLALDAISGASPSGAVPSGEVQTTTTPSGNVRTTGANEVPTASFKDTRAALDLEWMRPLGGMLTSTAGAHFSREKDYRSLGANVKLSFDLMNRLATVTVGAGLNQDEAIPVGGTPVGLSDGSVFTGARSNSKRVTTGVAGLSRVLTRRWMVAVDASSTSERGYLTEPYKVLSLVTPDSGLTAGQLKEKRPAARTRADVLASSVYHLTRDILYTSYRYYWDDWGVRSSTLDLKYRRPLSETNYLQPHLRLYTQTPADFYRYYLIADAPLPNFATSDYRVGPLRAMTVGLTYGFHLRAAPGEWSVRAEYIRQSGDGHPKDAVGALGRLDLLPPLGIGTLVVGYSVPF